MFDAVDPKQSFPALEHGILTFWKEEDIFKRSIKQRRTVPPEKWDPSPTGRNRKMEEGEEIYSFYDGPPFATGLPHYGHLLAGTIKDVIPRYQTMRGKVVERRFGWDCHGLPVENEVEKEHHLETPQKIHAIGVRKFNDLCRKAVLRYTKEWRTTVERMGRFVDMDNDYRTMDPDYMESIFWVFSKLHEKGLIYEGHKPMHICPRCATPLSNFEVSQGYRDRTDQSVIVTFPLKKDPETALLAWTTTPWSLPGNMWLAVGPKITYAKVQEGGHTYILARKLVETVFKGRNYKLIGSTKPLDLVGKRYEPLFPYFVEKVGERVFKVIANEKVVVSDEEGTGIVHLTSCTGEDSHAVATAEGVDVLPHVELDGSFIEAVTDFSGLNAKPEGKDPMATDKTIIENLKKRGRYFSSNVITHSYPHCWRCDTPLLPYTTNSWFVAVEKIKEKLLEVNARTTWVPAHIRDGRFGKWLENARDWAISRNRYWGTPLPIWRATPESGQKSEIRNSKRGTPNDMTVIGSRDELMQYCKTRFTKITALRHGESEGNLIPIYQGKLPGTNLTERGKQQALSLTKAMVEGPLQTVIYASPFARAKQTAEIIAKETGAKVVIDDRLREIHFGEYEGKTVDFSDLTFVKARRQHKLETGKPESIYHFPGMETWKDVSKRIGDFFHEILPKHRGEHIAIITHADPLENIRHFFTKEDPMKISHQPYPKFCEPFVFFWDHAREQPLDLHKDTLDEITWKARDGSTMRRIPEVLDCWFESGSMPYAQSHYPFAFQANGNSKFEIRNSKFREPPGFPADFIAEGLDQTRGWFYTLLVLSTALFGEPAFRNCIVNGIVLAEDGRKMSKRLKNYPEPLEVAEKYGADAVRFTLMSSPAVRGEDLRFSEKLVEQSVRAVLLPLWNSYSFFVTYANACQFKPNDLRGYSSHPLDQWIRAEVQDLVNRMTEELDRYDLSATCAELHETIDALTNWYIRLSRRRFAGKEGDDESQTLVLQTLYDALLTISQLLAPFCPFVTEAIYLNLVPQEHSSIHLTDWPDMRPLREQEQHLLRKHRLLRLITSLGLSIRGSEKIKIRQPLPRATIVIPPSKRNAFEFTQEDEGLLRSELNVKELLFTSDPKKLADVIVQIDPRKVGPRLGARTQAVIDAGKRGDFEEENGAILILDEAFTTDEAQITYRGKEGKKVAGKNGIIVSLETRIPKELQVEGFARDLIRAVQRLRKEAGLKFQDHITLKVVGGDAIVKKYGTLIAKETNATLGKAGGKKYEVRIGDETLSISFVKQ